MSLRFDYKKYPDTSGGFSYAAIILVNIALPSKNSPRSKRFEAFIDSGATHCVFHAEIGRAIGLQIEKGELRKTLGIGGETSIYMHEIHLYAPGGIIQTLAGFSETLPVAGLLGMHGFFSHFKVTFDPTAMRCELDRLYQA